MFDTHTFVNLVRAMRESQSKYFKTKDWNALNDSKTHERMVDKAIKEYDEEQAKGERHCTSAGSAVLGGIYV